VRISPIWNMLARLRGVTAQQGLEPAQVWEKTDPRRHANPRWSRNADKGASLNTVWDTDWVFTNTDAKCSGAGFGSISSKDWYNNPRKADTCLGIAQAFSRERGTCLKELANSFDICQIDELKDFCGAVQSIRAEVRQVNAVANQYTLLHKNLYLPSRYLKQDGMFAWSAMVETYNTIDPQLVSNPATCPGIHRLLQNAEASAQENHKCPATKLFQTSNFLEKVRNIVSSAVTIIVLAQNIVLDGIVFFLSVMAQDKGMMQEKAMALNSGLKSLVVKMLAYYGEMLRLLWDTITMQPGVFKSISDLIKKICEFARKMTLLALGIATSFLNAMKKLLPFISESRAIIVMQVSFEHVSFCARIHVSEKRLTFWQGLEVPCATSKRQKRACAAGIAICSGKYCRKNRARRCDSMPACVLSNRVDSKCPRMRSVDAQENSPVVQHRFASRRS